MEVSPGWSVAQSWETPQPNIEPRRGGANLLHLLMRLRCSKGKGRCKQRPRRRLCANANTIRNCNQKLIANGCPYWFTPAAAANPEACSVGIVLSGGGAAKLLSFALIADE